MFALAVRGIEAEGLDWMRHAWGMVLPGISWGYGVRELTDHEYMTLYKRFYDYALREKGVCLPA